MNLKRKKLKDSTHKCDKLETCFGLLATSSVECIHSVQMGWNTHQVCHISVFKFLFFWNTIANAALKTRLPRNSLTFIKNTSQEIAFEFIFSGSGSNAVLLFIMIALADKTQYGHNAFRVVNFIIILKNSCLCFNIKVNN